MWKCRQEKIEIQKVEISKLFCGGPGGGVERKTGGVDGIKLGYDDVIDVGNVYFFGQDGVGNMLVKVF